jgi:cytidylate kinase
MTKSVVIAVDGPAASGKGTLAKRLARHFGFAHLDSGLLYRLTGLGVLQRNGDPALENHALEAALAIDPLHADDPALREMRVSRAASVVATHPSVRRTLLDFQRQFAFAPPGGRNGSVIDGRDIGTVVCPGAPAKLFVDARPEQRARRRWLELKSLGSVADEAEILADIRERDVRDRTRAVAPLAPASDALLLDTSDLDIDAAFAAALDLVNDKVGEALRARQRG